MRNTFFTYCRVPHDCFWKVYQNLPLQAFTDWPTIQKKVHSWSTSLLRERVPSVRVLSILPSMLPVWRIRFPHCMMAVISALSGILKCHLWTVPRARLQLERWRRVVKAQMTERACGGVFKADGCLPRPSPTKSKNGGMRIGKELATILLAVFGAGYLLCWE